MLERTVEAARANPKALAKKTLKQIADHTTEIINALDEKPVVIGHSTGGLLAQMLAGRGLSTATVAIAQAYTSTSFSDKSLLIACCASRLLRKSE